MLFVMSSLHTCTTVLMGSFSSLQYFPPLVRLVKPICSRWRAYRLFSRLKIKQQNSCHIIKKQKQFLPCSSYFSSLQSKMSSPVWRYRWFCCSSRCVTVGACSLTFHKSPKNYCESINSFRHLSDSEITQTRKRVSKKIEEIKENILTIPNGLCFLRMVATPFLGYLVLQEWYATSLGLFIFAGFTDVVDGYIARNFPSQQSMIGSFLDPAADKILIATLFVTLTINGLIPVPLTSLIIMRDVCLMGAGFYIRYVSLPPPKTLTRYFDMSFVTARLSPTGISKVNTLVQLSLVACSLAAPVFSFTDHVYLQSLWYVTAVSTIVSAGSYLCYKNTYKVFATRMEKRKT